MPERGAVARPRPVAGSAAEAGPDGVLDDVARDVADEVVVREDRGAVAALEEVALPLVPVIEVAGVEALEPAGQGADVASVS